MGIERSENKIANLVDHTLSPEGKEIAIKLYQWGFTLEDPIKTNRFVIGHNYDYAYSHGLAKTREEAEELLKSAMKILKEHGVETGEQTIEAPEKEGELYEIKIFTNFAQVRDYDQSKKTLQGATTKTKGALKTTLGENI